MTNAYPHELSQLQTPTQLYIDLMKRCLLNWIYLDKELKLEVIKPTKGVKKFIVDWLRKRSMGLHYRGPDPDPAKRLKGKDWPFAAHTMVGLTRLDNLQMCVEDVLKNNIPGDFIETGVWRGGSCIFMRAILKAYNDTARRVWLADSFQGLPKPDFEKYPKEGTSNFYEWNKQLAVSLEQVQENFRRYGLLDDQVKFIKGWFAETLPVAPVNQLAILRLDGDMYSSTIVALNCLYPKLSVGGYIIVDDYTIPECNRAIHDYREQHGITEAIVELPDEMGAYWKRTK